MVAWEPEVVGGGVCWVVGFLKGVVEVGGGVFVGVVLVWVLLWGEFIMREVWVVFGGGVVCLLGWVFVVWIMGGCLLGGCGGLV